MLNPLGIVNAVKNFFSSIFSTPPPPPPPPKLAIKDSNKGKKV